jgi:hypothetical protein
MICQVSYPVGDIIPLRLIMTSESHEALELVAVPHAVDVRLFKVLAFGKNATVIKPFSLLDRSSYHHADLIAAASWELDRPDGLPRELPTDNEHPRRRWRIRLNGQFCRTADVEMRASIEAPSMAIRVCSANFGRDLRRLMSFIVRGVPLHIPCRRLQTYNAPRPGKAAFYGLHSSHGITL